jgi:hypothetical protein
MKKQYVIFAAAVALSLAAINSVYAFANPIITPKGIEYSVNLSVESIVNLIFLSPLLWGLSQLFALKNVKFQIAALVVLLGTISSTIILSSVFSNTQQINRFEFDLVAINLAVPLSSLITIWSVLVKHFFRCRWLKAVSIGLIIIIFLITLTYLEHVALPLFNAYYE